LIRFPRGPLFFAREVLRRAGKEIRNIYFMRMARKRNVSDFFVSTGIPSVIACAPLWMPAFLSGKENEEELSPQRLAEITKLKFPMDREEER
jgi:hypothetical protein